MKKLIIYLLALITTNVTYAQRKQILEPYSQKFYKFNNQIYGIKHPRKNPEAHLLKSNLKSDEVNQLFPYSHFGLISTSYSNVMYDINTRNFIVVEKYKKLSGDEQSILSFFPKEEPTEQNWSLRPRGREEISRNLTGISDFYMERMIHGSRRDYWHYDMILQRDETLLMPVAYKDSLYLYHFTDKAWTKPDYQGVEKNKGNDQWIRTSKTKHNFTSSFRAFELEGELYFLSNADTSLYKYQDNRLKEIGRIRPDKKEKMLFLIDKDDQKVYFLKVAGLDIFIEEEKKRFQVLTKEDDLSKAIQKIIDTSDVREKAGKK